MKLRSFVLAACLFLALPFGSSFAQVGRSVNIAPPVLPVYEQPPCPVEGYIWTPGYWAWGGGGYYWVPGVWVAPPTVGLLWTPAWWGWNNGVYAFHEGYWGPTVGFYGGINYGHGYWGDGYWGGHWEGNAFRYNTAVTRVNTNIVHNTYVDRAVTTNEVNRSHTAFNGPNGVKAEPTAEQKAAAENAQKMPPTSQQLARQEAASKDRNLQASVNKGHPNNEAIQSFNKREAHGHGAEGLGAGAEPRKAENKAGNMAERQGQGAGNLGEQGNKRGGENLPGNGRNLEGNQAKAHAGKGGQHGGPGQGPHAVSQQMSRTPQTGGGHYPKMGGNQPKMGGGGNRPHAGGQQQGNKKQGKPEKPHGEH